MLIAIFVIFYLGCAVLNHAIMFGYFQSSREEMSKDFAKEGYRSDFLFSSITSLFGPLALIAAFMFSLQHGFRKLKLF